MTSAVVETDRGARRTGTPLEMLAAFAKLGVSCFGGPIAHLGYFRAEFVERRRWLEEREFADLIGLCQFLPGPASSQTGFAIGLMRGGYWGGLAAWTGFTLPSAVLLVLFAYSAEQIASSPLGAGLLHGLKLVAVAIVAQAVWGMARSLCPDRTRASIATVAAILVLFDAPHGGLCQRAGAQSVPERQGSHQQQQARQEDRNERDHGAGNTAERPAHDCAQIGGEGEQRAGHGLGRAVPSEEGVVRHPAGCHHGITQQRQHHMAAAEHQRAGAIERIEQGDAARDATHQRRQQQQCGEQGEAEDGDRARDGNPGRLGTRPRGGAGRGPAQRQPRHRAQHDGTDLAHRTRRENAAVVGLLGAALYNPVWVSAVLTPADFALALLGFVLLVIWRAPPLVVVILGALGGIALGAAG